MENRSAAPPSPPLLIHSDGACSGNPGPGGWAVRICYPEGRVRELGGAVPATTNNRMELQAAIEALKAAEGNPVSLITDSEYLLKGITEWIHGWKKRGWLTASKQPVLNQDLWQELDRLNHRGVRWQYTRGHAGEQGNERCDEIAQAFSRGEEPQLVGNDSAMESP